MILTQGCAPAGKEREYNQLLRVFASEYNLFYNEVYDTIKSPIILSGAGFFRDIFANRLFSLFFLLRVIDYFSSEQIEKVIVHTSYEAEFVKTYISSKKYNICVVPKEPISIFRLVLSGLLNLIREIIETVVIKIVLLLFGWVPGKHFPLNLVGTFVTDSSLRWKRKSINDIYFPGLDVCGDRTILPGKECFLYWPQCYGELSNLINKVIIASRTRKYFFKESIIPFYMIIIVIWEFVRGVAWKSSGKIYFRNMDVASLMRFYSLLAPEYFYRTRLEYFAFEMLKKKGYRIDTFVDWFENQSTDRGVSLGMKDFFPGTNFVGYAGYVPPDTYIHLFPTASEQRNHLVPPVILVMGEWIFQDYKRHNKNVRLDKGFPYRFSGIKTKSGTISKKDNKRKRILTLLPMDELEVISLLDMCQYLVKKTSEMNVEILARPHPGHGPTVSRMLKERSIEEAKKEDELLELINNSEVILTGGSSAALEAIILGRYVILVPDKNGIIHNSIPSKISKDRWTEVYSKDDLLEVVIDIFNNKSKGIDYQINNEKILNQIFSSDGIRLETFLNKDGQK